MCGRYALYGPRSRSRVEEVYFSDLDRFPPTYNAAPSQWLPITRLIDGTPRLVAARWGLVPSWAKDERSAFKCINARAETIATNPMFRDAYRGRHRCLVPASGFFEWQRSLRARRPFYITSADGSLLAFAGLWDRWRRADGEWITSFTIITRDADEIVRALHERMPVILRPEHYHEWLETNDPRDVTGYPAPTLKAYAVGTRINNPQNNDAQLVQAQE
ncbi:MAG TPA: SOS response-associated peptidase, partial [Burkholderiales bacterium]|nr:SOS response-associated peptidase [Burkholderiales bacterium]